MKELYWKYMVQVKAWELYLKGYMQRTYRGTGSSRFFRLYFPQVQSGRYVRQGSISGKLPSMEGIPEMETEIACPE